MRLTLAALALTLATPLAAQEMTEAEREAFRTEVRAYLLDNPEVLMEAMDVLQARQAAAQEAADAQLLAVNMDALLNDPGSWVGGNPDGDITIVEFLDYRCGYCKRAFADVEELVATDGNIRFIVKEFPILGEASTLASRYAIATRMVAGDDAYKAMHDTLMQFNGDITPEALARVADALGLDDAAITARMNDDDITQIIAATRDLGQRLAINGTPTFVIGDELLRGYVPLDGMRQIVAEERG